MPTSQRPRVVRRPVHGVLLLDKPLGLTSNGALQQAKRLYRAEKAGHTGTLDPLATGLLPLCFGAATKFAQVSLDADKRYLATLQLGTTTTTGDGEGSILQERPVAADRAGVEAACAHFLGRAKQRPPMHSALKHDGKPLYDYARAGIEVERAERDVRIDRVDVVEGEGARWVLDVACSKGTYVRTLAEAIGERLGCGAHLAALRRTGSGHLAIGQAATQETLAGLDEAGLDALLLRPDSLVARWPRVTLSAGDAGRFLTGLRRRLELDDAPAVRVYGPSAGSFLGTGHVVGGELIPSRLLSPAEAAAVAAAAHPLIDTESSRP